MGRPRYIHQLELSIFVLCQVAPLVACLLFNLKPFKSQIFFACHYNGMFKEQVFKSEVIP
jgi:hypothetical protein